MYAIQTRPTPGGFTDTKHLVDTFSPYADVSSDTEEDSQGNRDTSFDALTGLVIRSVCGEEFIANEISMFGDADLCPACADAFTKMPRYRR